MLGDTGTARCWIRTSTFLRKKEHPAQQWWLRSWLTQYKLFFPPLLRVYADVMQRTSIRNQDSTHTACVINNLIHARVFIDNEMDIAAWLGASYADIVKLEIYAKCERVSNVLWLKICPPAFSLLKRHNFRFFTPTKWHTSFYDVMVKHRWFD